MGKAMDGAPHSDAPEDATDQATLTDLLTANERLLIAGLREQELADQLRRQLAFTAAITDNLGEGILALDQACRITFVNPVAALLLGWPAADLLGRDAHGTLPCPLTELARAGRFRRDDATFTRRDGSTLPVAYSAAPIGDTGAVVAFRDIAEYKQFEAARQRLNEELEARVAERTAALHAANQHLEGELAARRRAEAALRESEARFRTIFEQATDAILIADDEGRYLQANPAACALYGLPDEASFLGRRVGDFAPPAFRAAVRASWRQLVAEGSQSGTRVIQRPDGTTRFVEYHATANLQPGRHLSVYRDVTERELAEVELANLQRQLTAARETERLRLARELHDTAVQQLLGISFQLAAYPQAIAAANQPAGPVTTLADLRGAVLDTVDHLRGVIRELRPPGLEEFGLTAALDGYLSAIRRERGATLPAIIIDLDHVGDDVPHDVALCLFRVVQEALQNAIRHAAAHEISISLSRDDHVVTLRVADDGRGFHLPERLTVYTQLGHFGLAGMLERVKLTGGQLTIASSPGSGTTVSALIPLGQEGGQEGGVDERDTRDAPGDNDATDPGTPRR